MIKTVEQIIADANALADEYIAGCNAVIKAWKPKAEAFMTELTAMPNLTDPLKIAIITDMQNRITNEVDDML